jgi:hypothetical protein
MQQLHNKLTTRQSLTVNYNIKLLLLLQLKANLSPKIVNLLLNII